MVQLQIISDQQHALPVIQSAIAAKVKRIEIGLRKTEQEIQRFESKYHLSSEQFMNDCTAEDLDGGDDEYVSWMGELQGYQLKPGQKFGSEAFKVSKSPAMISLRRSTQLTDFAGCPALSW